MNYQQRSYLAIGGLLILVGVALLMVQMTPELKDWLRPHYSWPLWVIGVGVAFIIFGLISGVAGMAIPGTIVGGIGGILFWQNVTGNWSSWTYMWTLIPGFVGVGIVLSGILGGERLSAALREGLGTIVTSLVLFAIFGTFFGALGFVGPYWPFTLIVLGLLLVGLASIRGR